jgi:hypothetical protein
VYGTLDHETVTFHFFVPHDDVTVDGGETATDAATPAVVEPDSETLHMLAPALTTPPNWMSGETARTRMIFSDLDMVRR